MAMDILSDVFRAFVVMLLLIGIPIVGLVLLVRAKP